MNLRRFRLLINAYLCSESKFPIKNASERFKYNNRGIYENGSVFQFVRIVRVNAGNLFRYHDFFISHGKSF